MDESNISADWVLNASPLDYAADIPSSGPFEAWGIDGGKTFIFDDEGNEVASYSSREAAEAEWLLF